MRSCTNEAIEFAKALDAVDKNPDEVRNLFKTAIVKHLNLMEQCKVGKVKKVKLHPPGMVKFLL